MPRDLGPSDYYFHQFPLPLAKTERISWEAKRVWAYLYTHTLFPEPEPPPIEYVERFTGTSPRELSEALRELRSVGLLDSNVLDAPRGRVLEFEILWPEWIRAEGDGMEVDYKFALEDDADAL